MRLIDKVSLRLRSLFFKSMVDQELDEEVRFHVDTYDECVRAPLTLLVGENRPADESVLPTHERIVMMGSCKLSLRQRVATKACAASPAPGIVG